MEITKKQTNFEGRCPYSAILHYAYSCLIKRALTRFPRGNISSFNPRSYNVERFLWKGEVKLVSELSKASTSEIPLSGDWWFCKNILRFNAQYRHFNNFMNKIRMLIEKPYLFIGTNFVRFNINVAFSISEILPARFCQYLKLSCKLKSRFSFGLFTQIILSRRKIPFWMLPRNLYKWFRNKHLYMNFNSEFISCYYKVIVSPHENMKHEKKNKFLPWEIRSLQFFSMKCDT